jgi:hypothetical protein
MPGDNVEMVCSLVHDVAAEVGSRWVEQLFVRLVCFSQTNGSFTLREGGKTSKFLVETVNIYLTILPGSWDWYCH